MPFHRILKEEFRREVEKELTGENEESSELLQGIQEPNSVIEQAIETAARMLGRTSPDGHCLEMICADFLTGAHMDNGDPEILLNAISRYYHFLPEAQKKGTSINRKRGNCMKSILPKSPRLRLDAEGYLALHQQVLQRDSWRCQACGNMRNLAVHHIRFRSCSGSDIKHNLLTLCTSCHWHIRNQSPCA